MSAIEMFRNIGRSAQTQGSAEQTTPHKTVSYTGKEWIEYPKRVQEVTGFKGRADVILCQTEKTAYIGRMMFKNDGSLIAAFGTATVEGGVVKNEFKGRNGNGSTTDMNIAAPDVIQIERVQNEREGKEVTIFTFRESFLREPTLQKVHPLSKAANFIRSYLSAI